MSGVTTWLHLEQAAHGSIGLLQHEAGTGAPDVGEPLSRARFVQQLAASHLHRPNIVQVICSHIIPSSDHSSMASFSAGALKPLNAV